MTENSAFRTKRKISNVFSIAGLTALSCLTLAPLGFSLISSFKGTFEIYSNPFSFPESWSFVNYGTAILQAKIGNYVLNSLVIACVSIFILLAVSSMASFALSRIQFKLSFPVYTFFILGITVPVHSTIIPLYKMVAEINMLDNYAVLFILYTAFHMARSILIITGYMRGISREMEESAIIDGCNTWHIFMKIIIPLSMPSIATAGTIAFLYTYNDLLFPMLFISSKNKYSISQGLMSFQGEFSMELGPIFAAIIVCITPMLIIFILFQKQVISGLTAGSVKG